jgi:hypothetical protein
MARLVQVTVVRTDFFRPQNLSLTDNPNLAFHWRNAALMLEKRENSLEWWQKDAKLWKLQSCRSFFWINAIVYQNSSWSRDFCLCRIARPGLFWQDLVSSGDQVWILEYAEVPRESAKHFERKVLGNLSAAIRQKYTLELTFSTRFDDRVMSGKLKPLSANSKIRASILHRFGKPKTERMG